MRIELKAAGLPAKNEILEMAKGQDIVVIAGEEPLKRSGIIDIIKKLDNEKIFVETDGQELAFMAEKLKKAGVTGVNINVNTMRHSRYKNTHDGQGLDSVIEGINKAIDQQLNVRLNVALEKGFSDDEAMDFVQLTFQHKYDIVFLPTVPYENLRKNMKLFPVEGDFGDVEMFKYAAARGRLGFIKEA